MKHFGIEDISKFGFRRVTSECDALSLRAVYELTQEGWETWLHFVNIKEATPYPGLTNGYSSIWLTGDILPSLMVYCLFEQGFRQVLYIPAGRSLEHNWGWEASFYGAEGEEDPNFDKIVDVALADNRAYRCFAVHQQESAPQATKENGFHNWHYFAGGFF